MKQRATKTCAYCGLAFFRHGKHSRHQWNSATYCGKVCSGLASKKHSSQKDHLYAFSSPEPNTGCWLWLGVIRGRMGYGTLKVRNKNYAAHRLSYELHTGTIPSGMEVCHSCDVPSCINPNHLFVGTTLENKRDSVSKGRHNFGERHGKARLTEQQVCLIRKERNYGYPLDYIAARYGVATETVSAIVHRRSWRHI